MVITPFDGTQLYTHVIYIYILHVHCIYFIIYIIYITVYYIQRPV